MKYKNPTLVEDLLDQWFADAPAFTTERYLRSAILDLRLRFDTSSNHVRDQLVPTGSVRSPSWLPSGVVFPPCEGELLNWLFSDRRLSIIVSGTGSGKTSALSYIGSTLRDLSDARPPLLRRNNLLTLDIQSLNPDKFWDRLKDNANLPLIVEQFLIEVGRELDSVLLRKFDPEVLTSCFCSLFLPQLFPDYPDSRFFSQRLDLLKNKLQALLYERPAEHIGNWNHLFAKLIPFSKTDSSDPRDGLSAHELLETRLYVLYELSMRLSELPTALVIDNVDNYPEHLQRKLIDSLKAVTSQPFFRKRQEVFPPLTISVIARLSTDARLAGSFGAFARRLSFAAPDPADIVFLRLSLRLSHLIQDHRYQNLSTHDQAMLLRRSWFLWRCLAVRSPLRVTLSARSGTNVRNAYKYIRHWLLSERIERCPTVAHDYVARIDKLLAASVLLSRVQAATREVFFSNNSHKKPRESREKKASRLFTEFLRALRHAGRFTTRSNAVTPGEDQDFRHRLNTLHDNYALDLLADVPTLLTSCRRIVARGIGRQFNGALSRTALLAAMKEGIRRCSGDNTGEFPEFECEALLRRLIGNGNMASQAQSGNGQDQLTYFPSLENALRSFVAGKRGPTIRLRERLPSRWLSTSVMIAPDSALSRCQSDAVNLFSASGIALLEIPLILVSILHERASSTVTTGLLKRELHQRGFGDLSQVLESLKLLVRLDQRLIYLGIRDDREGVTRSWLEDDREVRLSCAGRQYMSILTTIPAYIQWCLLEIDRIREALHINDSWYEKSRAIDRIGRVREAFSMSLQQEKQSTALRPDKDTALRDGLRRSMMPVAWCLFNCLWAFIRDVTRIKTKNKASLEEARRWLVMADEARNAYRDLILEDCPKEWDESFAFANRELEISRAQPK